MKTVSKEKQKKTAVSSRWKRIGVRHVYVYQLPNGKLKEVVVSGKGPMKYEDRPDDGFHYTAQDDEKLLKARLAGKTYREITALFEGRHGSVEGCLSGCKRKNNTDAKFFAVKSRIKRLLEWESRWGDRKPLPRKIRNLVEKLRERKDEITRNLRRRGFESQRKKTKKAKKS